MLALVLIANALSLAATLPTPTMDIATEAAAVAQYRALSSDPAAMPDRLFVLQENAIGLREQAIARLVADRADDLAIREIAGRFADAHGQGVATLRKIAGEIGITVTTGVSATEAAQIDALRALSSRQLEDWWLLRQRAMHAWDIATFADYAGRSKQMTLDTYVRAVIQPLRTHSAEIDRLAAARGLTRKP